MTMFGPHCHHDQCGWIQCDAAAADDPDITHTCKRVAECPYCGPISPDWARLSAAWVEWCVGWCGTADSAELRALGVSANVIEMAELVEGNRVTAEPTAGTLIDADEHCGNDCNGVRDADGELENDPIPEECVHCECCCECLGCAYGPRDGMLLTEEQRAPVAELANQHAKEVR